MSSGGSRERRRLGALVTGSCRPGLAPSTSRAPCLSHISGGSLVPVPGSSGPGCVPSPGAEQRDRPDARNACRVRLGPLDGAVKHLLRAGVAPPAVRGSPAGAGLHPILPTRWMPSTGSAPPGSSEVAQGVGGVVLPVGVHVFGVALVPPEGGQRAGRCAGSSRRRSARQAVLLSSMYSITRCHPFTRSLLAGISGHPRCLVDVCRRNPRLGLLVHIAGVATASHTRGVADRPSRSCRSPSRPAPAGPAAGPARRGSRTPGRHTTGGCVPPPQVLVAGEEQRAQGAPYPQSMAMYRRYQLVGRSNVADVFSGSTAEELPAEDVPVPLHQGPAQVRVGDAPRTPPGRGRAGLSSRRARKNTRRIPPSALLAVYTWPSRAVSTKLSLK